MFKTISLYKIAFLLLVLVLCLSLVVAILPRLINLKFIEIVLLLVSVSTILILFVTLNRRIRGEIKRLHLSPSELKHRSNNVILESMYSPEQTLPILKDYISRTGLFIRPKPFQERLIYTNSNKGFWGSIIFHFSFIVVIFALLINLGWGQKLIFSLTEGETFDSQQQNWQVSDPGWLVTASKSPEFSLSLQSFSPPKISKGEMIEQGTATLLSAENQVPRTVLYGKGARLNSHSLILANWGYSPGLQILDSLNRQIFSGFIRVASQWTPQGRTHADSYTFNDGTMISLNISDDKQLELKVNRKEELNQGASLLTLKPGGFGEIHGLRIYYPELRTWNQYELQSSPGQFLLYLGLLMLPLGLMMRIVFTRRSLLVTIRGHDHSSTIMISGRAEKYRSSYNAKIMDLVLQLEPILKPSEKMDTNSEYIAQQAGEKEKHAVA